MRRLLFLILFATCMLQQVFAQGTQSLWVGQSYTCDGTSAMMGLTSDKSWTTSGGYFSLSGSGSYRTVTISQYFSGTASVTFSWKERLTSNSQWKSRSKTWYFTCRDNQVYITPSSMTLSVGESDYVGYSHQYDNSYTHAADVYFSSSNPTIASVNEHTGKVIAKSPGTTYINVYSKISSNTPYCKVTVREVDVESVSIPNSVSIIAGESKQLSNTIYPSNATVKTTQWYTNDASISTINSSGMLTAVKHGTTKVYCVINNSVKSNETTVTVSKSTLQLSASKEDGLLQKGTTVTLFANDAEAEIYYTTDGSVPTRNSIRYEGGVIIDKNLTLKAIACHEDYNTSEVLVKKYEVTSLEIVETYPVGTMKEYMIPYIKFNTTISKGDAFNSIKVSTSSIDDALEKMILSNNVLYIIPQDSLMNENKILTIDIPEGSLKNSRGEPCIAINMNLKISHSDSPYSIYAKEVYAGYYTSSALLSDGTLLNWGAIPDSKGSYDSGPYGLEFWRHIDDYNVSSSCPGSHKHNAYIDNDGNLWTWGYNAYGCLGDGEVNTYRGPENEYKVMKNVKEVACGGAFGGYTLVLTNEGVVYGFGENCNHQIEVIDFPEETFYRPVSMRWGVDKIYTTWRTSYVIKTDKSLEFLGSFYANVSSKEKFVSTSRWIKIDDDVNMVSAYRDELPIFIKSDYTLWACDNTISPKDLSSEFNYPKFNGSIFTYKITDNIKYIAGGNKKGMYIKSDGSLWSWGYNIYGEMGYGTNSGQFRDDTFPTINEAVKIMDNVKSMSLAQNYSLILKEDGSIWGCGDNKYGNIRPSERNLDGDTRPTPELIWQSTKAPSATAIKIDANKTTIGKEEQLPLNLIVEPSDAFCKNIQWRSHDETIATVSQQGIITGISEGNAIITAIVESHEGKTFEAKCQITIKGFSDIQEIKTNKINYQINNSILQLNNLAIGTQIKIYTVTGIPYYQGTANNPTMHIPLKDKGAYIINVGDERFKLINP